MGSEATVGQEIVNIVYKTGVWVGSVNFGETAKDSINPRKHRNPAIYEATKADIARQGISQPLLLRVNPLTPSGLPLLVVAGEGRWIIASELNMQVIPAIVKSLSDIEAMDAAGSENIHRNAMTPIEEADHAQRRLIEYKNDLESVSTELGWSIKKLKSRLLLLKAIPPVRKALAENTIYIGHADLLCSLTESSQEKMLNIIIDKKLDVTSTRSAIESLQRDLANACFDTAGCNGCAHNTSVYIDLFDSVTQAGQCRSSVCWDRKVQEQVIKIIDEANTEYGCVKRDTEVTPDSTIVLTANGSHGVGTEQLDKCSGCESYGAVINTTVGMEGKVKAPVCFNLACHTIKVQTYQDHLNALQCTDVIATDNTTVVDGTTLLGAVKLTKAPVDKAVKAAKPKAVNTAPPKAQRKVAYAAMAKAAAAVSKTAPNVIRAVTLCQLISSTRPDTSKLFESLDIEHTGSREDHQILMTLMNASDKQLEQLEIALVERILQSTQNEEGFEQDSGRRRALAVNKHLQINLKDHWEADPAFLGLLTKGSLVAACEASGFDEAYDIQSGDGKFKALSNGKASDFQKSVTNFPFDWKGWLPDCMNFESEFKNLFK